MHALGTVEIGGFAFFIVGALCLVISYAALRRARRPHRVDRDDAAASGGRMLEEVIENAADAILVLDPDGRIRLWNRGAVDTFGHTPSEAIGKPYDLLVPDGMAVEPALAGGAAHAGTVRDLRTTRRRKDGTRIEVSITRSRIRAPKDGRRSSSRSCVTSRASAI